MTSSTSRTPDDELAREKQDCIVVRCGRCRRATILSVNDGKMDASFKRDIARAVSDGATVEHMSAAETRKQDFGCRCGAIAAKERKP